MGQLPSAVTTCLEAAIQGADAHHEKDSWLDKGSDEKIKRPKHRKKEQPFSNNQKPPVVLAPQWSSFHKVCDNTCLCLITLLNSALKDYYLTVQ